MNAQPCPRCGKQNPADIHTCTPLALKLADALRALHEAKKYHPSGPGGQMCGIEQYRLVTSGLAFEDLQNAAAELQRLHAENELLRADAARYQFLRFADLDSVAAIYWPNGQVPEGDDLDEAIDAAMKAREV